MNDHRRLTVPLPPETRLLLLSAGAGLGLEEPAAAAARAAAFEAIVAREEIDWQRLLVLTVQQRAASVLWPQLAALPAGRVPAEFGRALQQHAMIAEFRQRHLAARLHAVLAELDAAGIRVLLLKGAALALTLYRDLVDRPMGDIDLLVDAVDALRAETLLRTTGWRQSGSDACAGFYEQHHHGMPLESADGAGIGLEIHTDLLPPGHPFRLRPAELWAAAVPVGCAERRAFALRPAHALLHAATHFVWSHMAATGAWRTFRDVHAFVRCGAIDWTGFAELALQTRAASCCYWTLRLARELSGAPVPHAVLHRLRPPLSRPLETGLFRHFATGLFPTGARCPSVRLSQWLWSAAIRPNRSGHGRSRPWQRPDIPAGVVGDAPVRGWRRVATHLERAPLWSRYLRSVLAFHAGGASPAHSGRASPLGV